MREMKDSGIAWIGEIPDGWKVKPIRNVFIENNAKNIHLNEKTALQFRYGDIVKKENFDADADLYVSETIRNYNIVSPGMLMVNGLNLNYDFVTQRVAMVKEQGVITSAYLSLKPIGNHVVFSKYFNYLLKTYDTCKAFHNMGGGVRKILSYNELKKNNIVVPNFKEQKGIADFLDEKCGEIDIIKQDIQCQIETLEQYKRSTITEAVTKGLNPNAQMKHSGIYYVGDMNESWRLTKIGFICTKLERSFEKSENALVCSNKGKVVIRDENAAGKMVSEDNAMQGIKKDDIAIHGMDTWHGAIAISEYDGKITRVVHVCDSREDKRFIVYYMKHLAYIGVYKLISNGVRGNTSDFRSWDKVKDISIALPNNLADQHKICDYLDNMCKNTETIISTKQRQLQALEEYKKSLIYEYVTGKKEVV